jgi:hypothetical protein
MSDNTLNAALRRFAYGRDQMTAHGFRATASTLLNELGWNGDAIERQLAHGERNGVRAVYNYVQYLPERQQMMQAWANYLDHLRCIADADAEQALPSKRVDQPSVRGVSWLGPNRVLFGYTISQRVEDSPF